MPLCEYLPIDMPLCEYFAFLFWYSQTGILQYFNENIAICLFANIKGKTCLFDNIVLFSVTINMPLCKYHTMLFAKWLMSTLGDYSKLHD